MTIKLSIFNHSELDSNSGKHICAISSGLTSLGFKISLISPQNSFQASSSDHIASRFLSYAEVEGNPYLLKDEDLFYFWSPRNKLISLYAQICKFLRQRTPYAVHLEDNDILIAADALGVCTGELAALCHSGLDINFSPSLVHPLRASEFIGRSAGVSVLSKALLKAVPKGLPVIQFWPGYEDFGFDYSHVRTLQLKNELDISGNTLIISYTGNVHPSNVEEVRSLYIAVGLLNRMHACVKLIRTGTDYCALFSEAEWGNIGSHVINLGQVSSDKVRQIQMSSTVLVQPGLVDSWNEARVPCKLPEFLSSSRPVMLPSSNIGKLLVNGYNAICLEEVNARAITENLCHWFPQRKQLDQIGLRGAIFARNVLGWPHTIPRIADFIQEIKLNA